MCIRDRFNIDLGGNRLTDLTALSEFMTNQPTANGWHQNLWLYDNGIVDISSLEHVTELGNVELQNNQIRDISALKGKQSIYHLNLEQNQIGVIGDTFDEYQNGANVYLNGNTLLCSEEGNLANSPANINWDGTCGEDRDGDTVVDENDEFPDDVAASVDSDGDGQPDDWNLGFGPSDSTTGLSLDNDDDGDGVADAEDAFPNNPFESADSDGDGVGDNSDAYPNDPDRQALELEIALDGISDEELRACIADHVNNQSFANDLRSLSCGEQIRSVEGIDKFVGLEELRFWNHDFTDVDPISRLPKLKYLEINWGYRVLSDIESLGSLQALESLHLDGPIEMQRL